MSDLLTAGEFDKFENMPVNTTSAAKDLVNCPKNPFGGAKITHRCTIFQPYPGIGDFYVINLAA
jgi:hypothetical protein